MKQTGVQEEQMKQTVVYIFVTNLLEDTHINILCFLINIVKLKKV
jgi:hypothetical protein